MITKLTMVVLAGAISTRAVIVRVVLVGVVVTVVPTVAAHHLDSYERRGWEPVEAVTTSPPSGGDDTQFSTFDVVAVVDGAEVTGQAELRATTEQGATVGLWHRDGVLADYAYSTWPATVFIITLVLWAVWAACLPATRWGDRVLATVAERARAAQARSSS